MDHERIAESLNLGDCQSLRSRACLFPSHLEIYSLNTVIPRSSSLERAFVTSIFCAFRVSQSYKPGNKGRNERRIGIVRRDEWIDQDSASDTISATFDAASLIQKLYNQGNNSSVEDLTQRRDEHSAES